MVDWPHAPPHLLGSAGVYMVTAGTYGKEHHFRGDDRLEYFHDLLRKRGKSSDGKWSVFPSHYHFYAESPANDSDSLRTMLRKFHSVSAK